MPIDTNTVKKVAKLARIEIEGGALEKMTVRVNGIMGWIEQLAEVNTDGVEPLANVMNLELKLRPDEVTDGGDASKVTSNAPDEIENYFVVPKILEQDE
jgi:aspartyl-tRNA(Asn)/glutamyl-tRNA(Gln) amidotransferase subunit C